MMLSTVAAWTFMFAAVIMMVCLPSLDAAVVCGDWQSIDVVNNRTYFLATNASRDLVALEQVCRKVDPSLHVLYSVSPADEQAIKNHPGVKNNMQKGVSTKIWTGYMSDRLAAPYWLDGSPVTYTNTLTPNPALAAPCTYLEINSGGVVTWGEAPCSDPLDFFCVMDDPPAVQTACPHVNYTAVEGHCYRYEPRQIFDYDAANATCAAEGAEVAGADDLEDMLALARGVCGLSPSCIGWVSGVNESLFSVSGNYECCRTLDLTGPLLAAPFTHTPCSTHTGFFCKIVSSNPRQNPPCITTTRRQSNYTFPPTADYALFLSQSIPAYVTPVTVTIGSTGLIFLIIGILTVCVTDVPKLYTDMKTKMVVNCKEKCRTPDDEVEKDTVTPI